MITLQNLDKIYFSYALPQVLEMQASEDVTLRIERSATKLVEVTLSVTEDQMAYFYDLRTLIEEELQAVGHPDFFRIYYADHDQQSQSDWFYVIPSAMSVSVAPDIFIAERFLTNATALRIPRSATMDIPLTYILAEGENCKCYTDYIIRQKSGSPFSVRMDEGTEKNQTQDYDVRTWEPSLPELQEDYDRSYPDRPGDIIAMTVHKGERVMTIFVTDDEPAAAFLFANAFGCDEWLFCYAETTRKTAVDRSIAQCNGRDSFYDQRVTRTNELKTNAITPAEADRYNELFISKSAYIARGSTLVAVLLTDIDSSISDDASDNIRMKFSWRLNDRSIPAQPFSNNTTGSAKRIFTNQYTNHFV